MTSWAKGFGPYGQTGFNPADWERQLAAKKANQPQLPPNIGDGGAFGPMTNADVNAYAPRERAKESIFASLGQGPMTEQDANVFAQQFAQQEMPQGPAMINIQEPMNGMMTLKDLELLKGLL